MSSCSTRANSSSSRTRTAIGGGVNNGIVEYCTIGYTVAAPNNYTNGIDVHTGQNWIIRDNVFQNILHDELA